MSDRLALANAIEDAGIARDKAQRLASVIIDAIHDHVATKADLQRTEMGLRGELRGMETRLTRLAIGGLVLATTALFAALHLWPPK